MWSEYADGATLRQVGKRHGVSGERVRQLLVESGYRTRSRGEARQLRRARTHQMATAVREELRRDHVNGCKSVRDIARERRLTIEAVQDALFG